MAKLYSGHVKKDLQIQKKHLTTTSGWTTQVSMTISWKALLDRLCSVSIAAHVNPLNGHALCIGGTLEYLLCNISFEMVKAMDRWKGDTFILYLRKHAQILASFLQCTSALHHASVNSVSLKTNYTRSADLFRSSQTSIDLYSEDQEWRSVKVCRPSIPCLQTHTGFADVNLFMSPCPESITLHVSYQSCSSIKNIELTWCIARLLTCRNRRSLNTTFPLVSFSGLGATLCSSSHNHIQLTIMYLSN